MSKSFNQDIDEILEQAVQALKAEIESVRKKPSSDVLFNGQLHSRASGDGNMADYKFETDQQGIRYAEEIKATDGKKEWILTPVSYDRKEIILRFPENIGNEIRELQVEWENDFVLQRTLQEILKLESAGKKKLKRVEYLFNPVPEQLPSSGEIADDGKRNRSQRSAIEKSMRYRTVFIWGPPGTGKTATLGYIMANYLKRGKRVLFASNTNRAVDVGLLSALKSCSEIGLEVNEKSITRFGEPALDDENIDRVAFEKQMEELLQVRREEAAGWSSLLSRQGEIMASIEKQLRDGKKPTEKQKVELDLIDRKIKEEGGRELLEQKMDELNSVNERIELQERQLVATTLAKICTSELFYDHNFDAVVIDEASMANLPYLIVLASRAKWHRVLVGDPMQLPPISITDDKQASDFLEKDIFTTVSGADSTESLFEWHDQNPKFTSFFDTQYRLEPSLADVISTVFYEGRLKSNKLGEELKGIQNDRAYHLIDTSKYNPVLTKKTADRGFQPVNVVHQQVVERLIRNMITKGIAPGDIGVMVPFRSVVYDLKSRLYEAKIRDVEVGTIHTFQGREKPYIIFDTVMSGEFQRRGLRHYSVRPLDEKKNGLSVPRLLNVAFSRSQKELMILADMRHIRKVYGDKFLGNLLGRLQS